MSGVGTLLACLHSMIMSERKAFSQYTVSEHAANDYSPAVDEVKREIDTRRRLYDRWVAEGKMTWQEGHDRMTRILHAYKLLLAITPPVDPADKPF